ncbi:MAG: hypothetical protein ACTH3B_05300, partial [Pseudoalteromonas sp.]
SVAVGTPVIICGSDYLKEDGVLQKEALYYKNASHISLPVCDEKFRDISIKEIINNIKKLNL